MLPILAPPVERDPRPVPVPTFSVVIAAYQAAGSIAEAVRSALDQVPAPLEVVVCDDGSTDDLAGALAGFGDRIRLIRTDHRGEASAKNAAADAARGDFVVILDADDVFLPGRLDALGGLAAGRPDLDILTTDAYLELDGREIGTCYHEGHRFAVEDQRAAILRSNFVFGLAAVRRARLLTAGGFDEGIGYTTDWDCWIRLVLDGARVGLVDAPLARYRLHEASMSAKRVEMARGRVATLTKALANPALDDREREVVNRTLAAERRRLAREELESALAYGAPGARGLARGVARSGDQPLPSRLKAAAAALAPGLVGRLVRRERDAYWTGVGDVRVRRR